MGLASEDNWVWVRAYFSRLLLEPERAGQVLASPNDGAAAQQTLHRCEDADALNAWLDRYVPQDAQLRCRNALYQRKCSQGLQRLSLRKGLHQDLMALAAEKGFTLNQTVEYLLGLYRRGGSPAVRDEAAPAAGAVSAAASGEDSAFGEADEDYREQMILWALCRSTGRKDDA